MSAGHLGASICKLSCVMSGKSQDTEPSSVTPLKPKLPRLTVHPRAWIRTKCTGATLPAVPKLWSLVDELCSRNCGWANSNLPPNRTEFSFYPECRSSMCRHRAIWCWPDSHASHVPWRLFRKGIEPGFPTWQVCRGFSRPYPAAISPQRIAVKQP